MFYDIPYHTQDEQDFCAAAGAMMLLQACGVPIVDLRQTWLYANGRYFTKVAGERLKIGPEGFKGLLNFELAYHSKSTLSPYDAFYFTTPLETVNFIRDRVSGSGWPVFTLLGGGHWVCVSGIGERSPGAEWIRFNNPEESSDCDHVPPHQVIPLCCGLGGMTKSPGQSIYRTSEFQKRLTPSKSLEYEHNKKGFVVIAARDGVPSPVRESAGASWFGPLATTAGSTRIPLLSRGPDALFEYELALTAEGATDLHWRTSLLESGAVVGEIEGALHRFVRREESVVLARRHFGIATERPVSASSALEWMFCLESRTPLRPFWRVTLDAGSERPVEAFVRIDGVVVPDLTPFSTGA